MAITFHCKYCNKKIEAKEEAAGKWGQCPSCHNKIYVPNLNVDISDLKLAPVDEAEERRKQQLMNETFNIEQQILSEKAKPEEKNPPATSQQQHVEPIGVGEYNEDKLYDIIIRYLRLMADSDLDDAKKLLVTIKASGENSLKLIDRIALADIPEAELADVPQQVLAGLIRTLRSQLL